MNFNSSISGLINQPLWQFTEDYFNIGQKTYESIFVIDKTDASKTDASVVLNATKTHRNLFKTIIKIVSYLTLILPLLAIVIRTCYRRKYHFICIKSSHEPGAGNKKPEGSPKVRIKDSSSQDEKKIENPVVIAFKKGVEAWLKKSSVENVLEKTYKAYVEGDILDAAEVTSSKLNRYFKDVSIYLKSQVDILKIVNSALCNLLNNSSDKDSVHLAKIVYKKTAAFLRKYTDKNLRNHIGSYEEYLNSHGNEGIPPAVYLYSQHFDNFKKRLHSEENHTALIFLLKQLRKQIKLATKQDKIRSKINTSDLPKERAEKALSYLSLTWLHGTKAFAVKSAYKQSNGEFLPAGELRKRKIQILTGEMRLGASILGINQNAISGVNLLDADTSVKYSQEYVLEMDEELKVYQSFLANPFKISSALDDHYSSFTRQIVALSRIKKYNPDLFETDRKKLKNKIQAIYKKLKKEIFEKKPVKLFCNDDGYRLSNLYIFLKELENFEELMKNSLLINEPETENQELAKIPIVVASSSKYGIPDTLGAWTTPKEEAYKGALKLGRDIQTIFAADKDIPKVQALLNEYNIDNSVAIESISILKDASQLEKELGSYFYDIYSIRKWRNCSSR